MPLNTFQKAKVIIGPPMSGKTTLVRELTKNINPKNIINIEGRSYRHNNFSLSSVHKETEVIIFEDMDIIDLEYFMTLVTSDVRIDKQGVEPFHIKPNFIFVGNEIKNNVDFNNPSINRRFELIKK